MKKELEKIKQEGLKELEDCQDEQTLNELKVKYLGKQGSLTAILRGMRDVSPEERPVIGGLVNDVRQSLESLVEFKQKKFDTERLNKKLESEKIDVTLPSLMPNVGAPNILEHIIERVEEIFMSMGYDVVDGPEIEEDRFNFELLNIPKDHPARDMQDTFYIDNNTLLRTHTSPMQAHAMKEANGKPIKIICPGKTYRRDNDDATHSHQFAQVEGLLIDKNINIGHLKALLSLFAKKMFGEKREIRFRSSYFPFTEPSVEIDISCFNCGGKGCSMCKGTGWIEILGGGMVHPNVLKMNGYDPEEYSGLAFGIGIERVAMLRYGIDDIRKLYTNDVRFLRQFEKKA